MKSKNNFEVERDYRRNHGIIDDDADQPADVPAAVLADLYDFFAQEALSDGDRGSSSTADDNSVIATALARLPKRAPTSGSYFTDVVKRLVDELVALQVVTANAEKTVAR